MLLWIPEFFFFFYRLNLSPSLLIPLVVTLAVVYSLYLHGCGTWQAALTMAQVLYIYIFFAYCFLSMLWYLAFIYTMTFCPELLFFVCFAGPRQGWGQFQMPYVVKTTSTGKLILNSRSSLAHFHWYPLVDQLAQAGHSLAFRAKIAANLYTGSLMDNTLYMY